MPPVDKSQLAIGVPAKTGRIDKSKLAHGEPERLRDDNWRNAMSGAECLACGIRDGTVVGAHIRPGQTGGTGLKPGDDLMLPLCHACHAETPEEWMRVLHAMARRMRQEWLATGQARHWDTLLCRPIVPGKD